MQKAMRLPADGEEAGRIVERARTGAGAQSNPSKPETQRMAPPLLYDLTELQRHANRLFGFSAQKTLDMAQALYERHKLISYPRTDSRHLSQDVARNAAAHREGDRSAVPRAPRAGNRRAAAGAALRRRCQGHRSPRHHPDHHVARRCQPVADERKIYDLICRRLLSAWHDDHIWSVTTVITAIANPGIDRPLSHLGHRGSAGRLEGARLRPEEQTKKPKKGKPATDEQAGAEQTLPPGLAKGQRQDVMDVEAVKKKTRPPKRFTEATLLTAMETAGKTLDEKELSDAMKETGLGTPATRAAIIEVLLKREYIVRNGKSLEATDKGIRLIEVVHPEVKSPAMTGQWEAYLKRIQRGDGATGAVHRGDRGVCAGGGRQGRTGATLRSGRAASPQARGGGPPGRVRDRI